MIKGLPNVRNKIVKATSKKKLKKKEEIYLDPGNLKGPFSRIQMKILPS